MNQLQYLIYSQNNRLHILTKLPLKYPKPYEKCSVSKACIKNTTINGLVLDDFRKFRKIKIANKRYKNNNNVSISIARKLISEVKIKVIKQNVSKGGKNCLRFAALPCLRPIKGL